MGVAADPVISLRRHPDRKISQHALEHVCCRHKGWGFPEESGFGSFPPSQSKCSESPLGSEQLLLLLPWRSRRSPENTSEFPESCCSHEETHNISIVNTHSERGGAGGGEEEKNRNRRRKGRGRGVEGGISRKIGGGEEEQSRAKRERRRRRKKGVDNLEEEERRTG